MADDNQLKVTFSAEWSGLIQATQQSSAAVTDFSNNVKSSMADVAASSTKALSPFANFRVNTGSFNAASGALKDVGESADEAGHASTRFYREIVVLGHEMLTGRFSRIPGSMAVLLESSNKLGAVFGAVTAFATPMNLAIVATGVALAAAFIESERTAESLAKINVAMSSVGNGYLFDPTQVDAMTKSLSNLAGVSSKDATNAMVELGNSADLTEAELQKISGSMPDLVSKFGSAEAAGKGLKEAIDNPAASLRSLHDELARNNPGLLDMAENALQAGNKSQASALLIDYLTESSKGLHDKGLTPLSAAWEYLKTNMEAVVSISAPLLGALDQIGHLAETTYTSVMHLSQAFALMKPGVVGLQEALKAVSVQDAGQTYNMDQSTAFIENTKQVNEQLANTDTIVRKLNDDKLDKLQDQLKQLKVGLADAQGQGDMPRVAEYQEAIVQTQQKLNEQRTEAAKKAQSEQLQDWEANLTAQLQSMQLFGDQAKAFELKYWQDKQQVATQGTAEYKTITDKIYNLQSENYTKDLEAFKKSEEQKTEEQKKAYDAETQSILKYYDELAAQYKNDFTKFNAIEQQKLAVIKAIYGQGSSQAEEQQKKITQDQQQQVTKLEETYKGYFATFNNGILGMIKGTETFQQAFSNTIDSLLEKFLQMGEDIAAKWLATELVGETTAKTQAVTAIGASAAQAGAAAFASTAAIPVIGPSLAPAAGAAAYAGAMAYEGLASFDVGSYNLPSDMIAQVHQGEMIIPRTFADDMRSNGGIGGGGNTHVYNISAMDSSSFHDFVQRNPHAIAAGLVKANRLGNRGLRGLT